MSYITTRQLSCVTNYTLLVISPLEGLQYSNTCFENVIPPVMSNSGGVFKSTWICYRLVLIQCHKAATLQHGTAAEYGSCSFSADSSSNSHSIKMNF